MKKLLIILLIMTMLMSGCSSKQPNIELNTYSNLYDDESREEVMKELKDAGISDLSIKKLDSWLDEFQKIQGETELTKGFVTYPEGPINYDYFYMDNWMKQNVIYSDINCRITSFLLFSDFIQSSGSYKGPTNLLMFDLSAINDYSIVGFTAEEKQKFIDVYAEIPAEITDNSDVHVKEILNAWKERGVEFKPNDKVSIINVFIHDLLDNVLFVGHSAILVETDYGYLLLEKYAPQYPYQASRFATKEDVFKSLDARLGVYTEPGASKPIYMENDKLFIEPLQ